MREALTQDAQVFLMGKDVGRYGGSYAVSAGLLEAFGPKRVRDAPLSEFAFADAGIDAALGGMRPVAEVMTVNFSLLALEQIVYTDALYHHMSGGQERTQHRSGAAAHRATGRLSMPGCPGRSVQLAPWSASVPDGSAHVEH